MEGKKLLKGHQILLILCGVPQIELEQDKELQEQKNKHNSLRNKTKIMFVANTKESQEQR